VSIATTGIQHCWSINIRNFLLYNKCFLCHNHLEIYYEEILFCPHCDIHIDTNYKNNHLHIINTISTLSNRHFLLLEFKIHKYKTNNLPLNLRIRNTTNQSITNYLNNKNLNHINQLINLIKVLRKFS
jgi:hypothetical protein